MKGKQKKGFSLVEMVIYVGLLTLFLLLIIDVVVVMSTSYQKLYLARVLSESATVSMERITREIRTATSVDLVQSVLDANPGKIRLHTTNKDGYAQVISFMLEDGRINIYENDLLTGSITSARASTTALVFHLFSNSRSKAVGIDMTIQAEKGSDIRTESFRTSVELRNSF